MTPSDIATSLNSVKSPSALAGHSLDSSISLKFLFVTALNAFCATFNESLSQTACLMSSVATTSKPAFFTTSMRLFARLSIYVRKLVPLSAVLSSFLLDPTYVTPAIIRFGFEMLDCRISNACRPFCKVSTTVSRAITASILGAT